MPRPSSTPIALEPLDMTAVPHSRSASPTGAGSRGAADAPLSRPSLRRIVAAAICVAFVLVPASALSARSQGAAKARPATSADVGPKGAVAGALPPAVAAILRGSGLPTKSFAFDVRAVDGIGASPLVAFHAEQPFLLASTTKVVTSLAALDLLGAAPPLAHQRVRDRPGRRRAPRRRPRHRRRPGRPDRQRAAPLVPADARRRAETIAGNIVLDDVALLHERDPKQARDDRARARSRRADRRAHLQPRQAARLGEAGRAAIAPS